MVGQFVYQRHIFKYSKKLLSKLIITECQLLNSNQKIKIEILFAYIKLQKNIGSCINKPL